MDVTGIYVFDHNMGMTCAEARLSCTILSLILIFLSETRLSVVKSRSVLSPLAFC